MKICCENEARAHVKKHRDVASCETCNSLILGYGNEADYQKMVKQLEIMKVPFETAALGSLHLVIKPRP